WSVSSPASTTVDATVFAFTTSSMVAPRGTFRTMRVCAAAGPALANTVIVIAAAQISSRQALLMLTSCVLGWNLEAGRRLASLSHSAAAGRAGLRSGYFSEGYAPGWGPFGHT